MRIRLALALAGVVVLLTTSGCAPAPSPAPSPSPVSSASPSASPTPTAEPIVEPEIAFDVTCDDVGSAVEAVIGATSTPVSPVLSLVSTMGWIPGPPQHMFQRAGGIACSAGDATGYWEVTIVPGAAEVIPSVEEKIGEPFPEGGFCTNVCGFEITDGDVHLSATVHLDGGSVDSVALETALRALASDAASSLRDVTLPESDIVDARCEHFLRTDELSALIGEDAQEWNDFGGWSIPAEVYEVVNGSRICIYSAPGDGYDVPIYLMITSLPAGAWAFETQDGEPIVIEGADEAKTSTGEGGTTFIDVRIGADWLRMTTYDGAAAVSDPSAIAARVVRNLTVGHPAPE